MEKLKKNEGKVNVAIIILFVIIAIAGIVLILKMTGVIKSEKKSYNDILQYNNTTNSIVSNIQSTNDEIKSITNTTLQTVKTISNAFAFIILVVEIGLNIGICKLYQKLQMPGYIVIFNFLWPILNIIQGFFNNWFGTILSIIYYILQVASLCYYFKAVGMSKIWAFLPTLCELLAGFGIAASLIESNEFFVILAMIGIISFLIAYIISNIRLGKIFEKGTGFTVGLALLPFIFQPILGYSKAEKPTYHDLSNN